MKRTFRGYEQQDSHEFLTILIDSLHEDLKEVRGSTILMLYAPILFSAGFSFVFDK